jgi:hypothetical protein
MIDLMAGQFSHKVRSIAYSMLPSIKSLFPLIIFNLFVIFFFCSFAVFVFSATLLELEIKHKHGGFNINYEKATVVWQQFGFGL